MTASMLNNAPDTMNGASGFTKKSAQQKSGVADAAAALRNEIVKVYPPPPTQVGVFARHVPHDRVVPEDREGRALRHLAEEIEKRTVAVDRMHLETGARIDAWQELPKESAVAVAEARSIALLLDDEIAAIDALRSSVSRALHAAKGDQLTGARKRIEALKDAVDRAHRDAEADKHALLVHGKAADAPAATGQKQAGAAELPLPAQATQAMADAIERRQAEVDVSKLPALIADEQRTQLELEKRLGQALEAAREAIVAEGVNELRTAFDAVRAWGHSLAFEARRFKKP